MTMRLPLLAAALWVAAGLGQEPRRDFELLLPDFFETPFAGGTVIDVPERAIQRLSVQVLQTSERNIGYGNVFLKVNGKGMGNAVDRVGNEKGILMTMTPFTAGMRPDEVFDAKENVIEAIAQDRRGRRYYGNWIVRVNESQQNQLFIYTSQMAADDPKGVPPDIVLQEPKALPVVGLLEKSIKVRVQGQFSGAGSTLKVNGKPAGGAATQALTSFDETVVVARDQKEILVEAADRKGHRRAVRIPVVVQEKAPARVRFAGARYALLVGLSRYGEQKGAPPLLASAAADVTMLAAELVAKAGFKKENIRLLTDDRATPEQIRVGFSDFAAQAAGEDLLLVYVATHGLHDPSRAENLYVAAHGTQMDRLSTTAVAFADLEKLAGQSIRCNNTFLVFDVGHKLEDEHRIAGKNLINRYVLNLFSDEQGRAVLVSGAADQVSTQRSGAATGALAHWLAESLAGKADGNRDNVVTAEELFRYVAEQVRVESQGAQTPRFRLAAKSASVPLVSAQAAPRLK